MSFTFIPVLLMCQEYSQLQAPPSILKLTLSAPSGAVLMCIHCVLIQRYYIKSKQTKAQQPKSIKSTKNHMTKVICWQDGCCYKGKGMLLTLPARIHHPWCLLWRAHNLKEAAQCRGNTIVARRQGSGKKTLLCQNGIVSF